MELDRRTFIKGAGAAGGAAVLMSLGACTAAGNASDSKPAWMPEKWDKETDVVVIGTGSIISAALQASDKGLDVIVLEKDPKRFGGTTALLLGGMTCPNSTQALEAGMPEIPRDLIKKYFQDVAEGQSTDELIDMMIDNYVPTVDYLTKDCGFPIVFAAVTDKPAYNLYRPFSEIEKEYAGVCGWIMCGPHPSGAILGRAWVAFGKDACEERGIEVMYGTAATKLIYSGNPALGDGEVVGVYAQTESGVIAIKARQAVVIGTGGFDHNREMVKHYLPAPMYATIAVPTNTGDGHVMAMVN